MHGRQNFCTAQELPTSRLSVSRRFTRCGLLPPSAFVSLRARQQVARTSKPRSPQLQRRPSAFSCLDSSLVRSPLTRLDKATPITASWPRIYGRPRLRTPAGTPKWGAHTSLKVGKVRPRAGDGKGASARGRANLAAGSLLREHFCLAAIKHLHRLFRASNPR